MICYILRETRILMPAVAKDGGQGGPHLQKVGGQSQKMGAIGSWSPFISIAEDDHGK